MRARAYASYSNYRVGAAVRGDSGKVYGGCNIENASYGLTLCAERVAVFNAISNGERSFDVLAVVTENGGMPCGACRQVLWEFAPSLRILAADEAGQVKERSLAELFSDAFGPLDLSADNNSL